MGNGGRDLYLLDLAFSKVTQLTNTSGYENFPAFSPNGKSIAYQYAHDLSSPRYLFLRSLDGKHVQQLTQGTPTSDSSPAFSWSGEKIVFCRSHTFHGDARGENTWDQQDVYIINRNGTGLLRLTHGNYQAMLSPRFYPGDDKVLFEPLRVNSDPFSLTNGVQGTLARVDTSGGGQPVVLQGASAVGMMYGMPCFTPDGKQIVYGLNRNGTVEIYRAATDGSGAMPLKTGWTGTGLFGPKASHDGKHIFYLNRDGMSLWRMDADGDDSRQIASGSLFSDPMHWKPGD